MRVSHDGPVEGFCGFFDVFFRGSPEDPVEREVTLTTSPGPGNQTHWGQQMFGFYPPMQAKRGDILGISLFIRRQERNQRLLKLEGTFTLYTPNGKERVVKDEREETYWID